MIFLAFVIIYKIEYDFYYKINKFIISMMNHYCIKNVLMFFFKKTCIFYIIIDTHIYIKIRFISKPPRKQYKYNIDSA